MLSGDLSGGAETQYGASVEKLARPHLLVTLAVKRERGTSKVCDLDLFR